MDSDRLKLKIKEKFKNGKDTKIAYDRLYSSLQRVKEGIREKKDGP